MTLQYAERQLRYFQQKVAELRQTSEASDAKEGKDAHEHAVSSAERTALQTRESRVRSVADYNAEIGGNVDAEYFVDYYADNWPKNWQARLRNWLKEGKKTGRIKPKRDATRVPAAAAEKPADWTLCAERCANCRGNGCACGITIPPAWEERPRPPEECPKYKGK